MLLRAVCLRLTIRLGESNRLPVLSSIERISNVIKLSIEVYLCVHNSALTTVNQCTFRDHSARLFSLLGSG